MLKLVKIRERSHIILWTLLFFFVLSMVVGGLVGGANIMTVIFGEGDQGGLYVGVVDDIKITRQEFLQERSNQIRRLRQQNNTIDSRAIRNAENNAWNTIVDRIIINQKVESLGLESSDDEIYDYLLYSPPISLQNQLIQGGFFTNEDGQFDLESYQYSLQSGTYEVTEEFWRAWDNYLRSFLPGRKLQSIYNMTGSISDTEIMKEYIKRNHNCTVDYIFVNSNNIADSLIEVSDSEISDEYNNKKEDNYKIEKSKVIEYILWDNPEISEEDSLNIIAIQDSLYQDALLFSEDAKYSTFSQVSLENAIKISDTLKVTESYDNNSGIPVDLGLLRSVVRFSFDNNIGTISDPITTDKGFAVFHIIRNEDSGFKALDDVKVGIRSQLVRTKKKELARNILEKLDLAPISDMESIAKENDLIEFKSGEVKNIGGSFTGVGKSSAMTGTLLGMEIGDITRVLETFNTAVILKMIDKDNFSQDNYDQEKDALKSQLLNSKRLNGYNNWLVEIKKEINIEDFRSTQF